MKAEFHGLLDEHPEGLRKPLYLQGKNSLSVALDGPALRIAQPERAMSFYPLARLARVLSKGGVHWSCEALLACAEARIPVVFLGDDGRVRGYWFGPSLGEDTLYRQLREGLRRTDGLRSYQEWQCLMTYHAERVFLQQWWQRGHLVVPVLARLGLSLDNPSRRVVLLTKPLLGRLRGLLAGLSAQVVLEAGIDAQRLYDLEPLPLVDDVAELLIWAVLEPVLLAWHSTETRLDVADERGLTALVEAQRETVLQFGRVLLAQLQHCLEA